MWKLDSDGTPPLWRHLDDPHLARIAFTTRLGGVSPPPYDSLNLGRSTADDASFVAANRTRVLAALDLSIDRLATAGQIHGAVVTRVNSPGLHPDCDALVTTHPGLALAVSGADCLPILFTTHRGVAVAHAGWRGVAAHIPRRALEALCDATGLSAGDVHVHFGPANRPCCYEVGPEVAAHFPAPCVTHRGESLRLDVPGAARLQLEAVGVDPAAIQDVGECTSCSNGRYFSHRRDRGVTGRQWGVVAMATRA
ncbi:MAG: peptidoglycan editing factor PgeF [Candidatus Eisenbacteria bacterium]|uniref:Purine nucleoside phosphorylase n=1 Tax=Eiseniibacteriota bacterium TaxID=2212470 RepID=A0A849SMR8_UNCEI|nr:peptidoglycan editing factor PgeF [Candidatus Eisenbacteria bacterium]